jgi:molybdate transport system substrate-binding protein
MRELGRAMVSKAASKLAGCMERARKNLTMTWLAASAKMGGGSLEAVMRFPARIVAKATVLFMLFTTISAASPVLRAQDEKSAAKLTVSAAISLKDALDEIAKLYEEKNPGVSIAFNYGGSGTLQHQIEQGAPVDIFFSASEKQMDDLQKENLILLDTRHDILRNSLVLVTPSTNDSVKDFADLAKPGVKTIALGEAATVPAGMYAQQTLQHLNLFDAIKSKVVYAKDVRQVLTYVETGNADAGLVYRTDAMITNKVRIAATAPEDSHELIVYPVAVLKATKQAEVAREFVAFIGGPVARPVFMKYGFAPPPIRD